MQEKSEPNTFHKIIEQGNSLLEAGVIGDILQFRLTVTESVDVKNIYIGEIKSLEEHGKLKESFDSFQEVLEFIKDSKNIKINLDDTSVTLVSHFGKKISEVVKVMLEKLEKEVFGPVSLKYIIVSCNQKGQINNDQIKRSFEVLAKQIMQLKQQQRKETFESLKLQVLGKIEQQNHEMEKKHENLQQKQSNQIQMLKKEISALNEKYVQQMIDFNKFQNEVCEGNQKTNKNYKQFTQKSEIEFVSFKNEIQKIKSLNNQLNNKMKIIQKMKQQISKQFQKTQILQQKMVYLNVYVLKQKYQLNIKFYKQQKSFKQYTFDGKTLTKLNSTQNGLSFAFFEQVSFEKQFRFHMKIVKSKKRCIRFGIIDYKQSQSDLLMLSCIVSYPPQKLNIDRFSSLQIKYDEVLVGETVEMVVNRNNKTIKWMVNGVQREPFTHKIFDNKDRQLLPYVAMYDKQDTIELLIQ